MASSDAFAFNASCFRTIHLLALNNLAQPTPSLNFNWESSEWTENVVDFELKTFQVLL